MSQDDNTSRRAFLGRAAYVVPAILTVKVNLAWASIGSGRPGDGGGLTDGDITPFPPDDDPPGNPSEPPGDPAPEDPDPTDPPDSSDPSDPPGPKEPKKPKKPKPPKPPKPSKPSKPSR